VYIIGKPLALKGRAAHAGKDTEPLAVKASSAGTSRARRSLAFYRGRGVFLTVPGWLAAGGR
jgi:hypothetical protein